MTHPSTTNADANNRAVRTFVQGLGLDVATALVLVLVTTLTTVEWTREYWYALLVLLAKTAVHAVVSYVSRKVVPPAVVR